MEIDFLVSNGGNTIFDANQPDDNVRLLLPKDVVEALSDTSFFSMKKYRWYPASRFNILGSGPPSLSGHSLNYTQWRNDPGGVVVFSDSGVWLLGGVDNLASIISEKKAGKDEEGKGE